MSDMTHISEQEPKSESKLLAFWKKWEEEIRRLLRNAFIVLVGVWVMFGVIAGVGKVGSVEMTPAVNLGDIVIYYRLDKTPTAREVIVFVQEGTECIGRVIAIPGDKVEISDAGQVFVNGHLIQEDRIYDQTYPYPDYVSYPITLQKDEYFVLGDNRKSAVDSRYYGPVTKDEIKGTLLTVIRQTNI